ncbi:hypothetical protein LINGRAHAP2_LOCUS16041 [Linum grandiflorum]
MAIRKGHRLLRCQVPTQWLHRRTELLPLHGSHVGADGGVEWVTSESAGEVHGGRHGHHIQFSRSKGLLAERWDEEAGPVSGRSGYASRSCSFPAAGKAP